MNSLENGLEPQFLIAIAFIALALVGIAGITHTVIGGAQSNSVDRARFLVIALFGSLAAIGAYLPILFTRWIESDLWLFRVCTVLFLLLVLWGERWRVSYPQITKAIQRMYRESQYPRTFSNILRIVAAIAVVINLISWPITTGQTLYELLLMFVIVLAFLHFFNLVIFRIADSPILENPINAGWEAVIYEPPGDEGWVLKLFNFYDRASAEHEVETTKAAHDFGLPCPEVHNGVVEMHGRFGFYMRKIEGKSFADQGVYSGSSLASKLSTEFGRFHAQLHELEGIRFPRNFNDVARSSIKNAPHLSEDEKNQVLATLERLPHEDRVYHGDFHPGNVMRRNDTDELVILDWVRAMTGHPLADVARASDVLSSAWLEYPPLYRLVVRKYVNNFVSNYEKAYFDASKRNAEDIEPWRLVVAAMRLGEAPISNKQARTLLRNIRKYLRDASSSDQT